MTFYILSVNISPDHTDVLTNNSLNLSENAQILINAHILSKTTWREQGNWVLVCFHITPCEGLTFPKTLQYWSFQARVAQNAWMPRYANGPSRYTESYSESMNQVLQFGIPFLLLLSKVSFCSSVRKCFSLVLNLQIVSPQFWPFLLPVKFWPDLIIHLMFLLFLAKLKPPPRWSKRASEKMCLSLKT